MEIIRKMLLKVVGLNVLRMFCEDFYEDILIFFEETLLMFSNTFLKLLEDILNVLKFEKINRLEIVKN
jgi:hypothetical protein